MRAPTSGFASLRCRSSDSLGKFRFDECAAHVKLLEDEVQYAFLGRRLGVWQKVPPERYIFLVGGNDFSDAWILHGGTFHEFGRRDNLCQAQARGGRLPRLTLSHK